MSVGNSFPFGMFWECIQNSSIFSGDHDVLSVSRRMFEAIKNSLAYVLIVLVAGKHDLFIYLFMHCSLNVLHTPTFPFYLEMQTMILRSLCGCWPSIWQQISSFQVARLKYATMWFCHCKHLIFTWSCEHFNCWRAYVWIGQVAHSCVRLSQPRSYHQTVQRKWFTDLLMSLCIISDAFFSTRSIYLMLYLILNNNH